MSTKHLDQTSYPIGFCESLHRGCAILCVQFSTLAFVKPKCNAVAMEEGQYFASAESQSANVYRF